MVIIYTGNGKGKTSACVGQAIRALGQDMQVAFVQFMKRDEKAGEQIMLRKLLGERYLVGGLGFFRKQEEKPAHREAALRALNWAKQQLSQTNMLIMDESIYALQAGLLEQHEMEEIMTLAQAEDTHLVLSGRDAPQWLQDAAHLVTNMGEVKHPWQQGIKATKGIEF